jgi:hypothetical protein
MLPCRGLCFTPSAFAIRSRAGGCAPGIGCRCLRCSGLSCTGDDSSFCIRLSPHLGTPRLRRRERSPHSTPPYRPRSSGAQVVARKPAARLCGTSACRRHRSSHHRCGRIVLGNRGRIDRLGLQGAADRELLEPGFDGFRAQTPGAAGPIYACSCRPGVIFKGRRFS